MNRFRVARFTVTHLAPLSLAVASLACSSQVPLGDDDALSTSGDGSGGRSQTGNAEIGEQDAGDGSGGRSQSGSAQTGEQDAGGGGGPGGSGSGGPGSGGNAPAWPDGWVELVSMGAGSGGTGLCRVIELPQGPMIRGLRLITYAGVRAAVRLASEDALDPCSAEPGAAEMLFADEGTPFTQLQLATGNVYRVPDRRRLLLTVDAHGATSSDDVSLHYLPQLAFENLRELDVLPRFNSCQVVCNWANPWVKLGHMAWQVLPGEEFGTCYRAPVPVEEMLVAFFAFGDLWHTGATMSLGPASGTEGTWRCPVPSPPVFVNSLVTSSAPGQVTPAMELRVESHSINVYDQPGFEELEIWAQ